MEVMGQPGNFDKQVCTGSQGGGKHVRPAGGAWVALAQEQIWHDQQQQQAEPCLNKNMSHSEMIYLPEVIKSILWREAFISLLLWAGVVAVEAGVGKKECLLCKI